MLWCVAMKMTRGLKKFKAKRLYMKEWWIRRYIHMNFALKASGMPTYVQEFGLLSRFP